MVEPAPNINSSFDDEISALIEKIDNSELSIWVNSTIGELDEDVLELPDLTAINDLLDSSEVVDFLELS